MVSSATSRTAPIPPPDDEREQADIDHTAQQHAMASELADMGIHLARAAFVRACKNPSAEADAAYNRIARAAERALALAAWLLRFRRVRSNEHAVRKTHADQEARRTQTRQLRAKLEDEAAAAPAFSDAQRFRMERYLQDFYQNGEPNRPIPEILQEIRAGLGLPPLSADPAAQPPLKSDPPTGWRDEPPLSHPPNTPGPTQQARPKPPD